MISDFLLAWKVPALDLLLPNVSMIVPGEGAMNPMLQAVVSRTEGSEDIKKSG